MSHIHNILLFRGRKRWINITSKNGEEYDLDRRTLLKTATAATATGILAGCSGDEPQNQSSGNSTETPKEDLIEYTGEDLLNSYLGNNLADERQILYDSSLNDNLHNQEDIIQYIEDEVENTEIYEENGTFVVKGREEEITGAVNQLRNQNSGVLEDLEQLDSWYDSEFRTEEETSSDNMTFDNSSTENRGLGEIANTELNNETSYNELTQGSETGYEGAILSFDRVIDIYASARELDNKAGERTVETGNNFTGNQTELEGLDSEGLNITSVGEENTTFNVSDTGNKTSVEFNESVSNETAEEAIQEKVTALGRSSESYTQTLLSNLEDFEKFEKAFSVGEEYRERTTGQNTGSELVDNTRMLQASLDKELTSREISFLAERSEGDRELPSNPISNEWAEDGVGNHKYMDLGIDPVEGNELIAGLNEHTYSETKGTPVSFTRESRITGEEYTVSIEQETFNDLLENEFELILNQYGNEEKSDWEKGSEQVNSRDEALREVAHFNIAHKEVDSELTLELTRELTDGDNPERRSITWSPRKIENLAAVNKFTDLYLENGMSDVSVGFYDALKDDDLNEEVIRNITEEIEEKKEIPRGYGDDPEDAEQVMRRNTPRSTSGSDDNDNDNGGGGPPGGGGPGGGKP